LECRLFKRVCHPENPVGPCMVSIEGTCHTYFKYQ
jgi:hydrogenase expression/formation protein HypD